MWDQMWGMTMQSTHFSVYTRAFFKDLAGPMSILSKVLQISVRQWCEKREKAVLIKKMFVEHLLLDRRTSEQDTEFKMSVLSAVSDLILVLLLHLPSNTAVHEHTSHSVPFWETSPMNSNSESTNCSTNAFLVKLVLSLMGVSISDSISIIFCISIGTSVRCFDERLFTVSYITPNNPAHPQ